jgi:hypothetical protein
MNLFLIQAIDIFANLISSIHSIFREGRSMMLSDAPKTRSSMSMARRLYRHLR